MMRVLLTAMAGLVLAGCSAQPAANTNAGGEVPAPLIANQTAGTHPISGLEIIEVSVESGQMRHVFRTELANTPQSQAKGMMFRTEMGDDEAMLFPSDLPAPRSFWMKNTPLSLDIIFVGVDGRISNIAANAVPYSLDSVLSQGPTIAVLEIRGGLAAELGITAGDRVIWPGAPEGKVAE